VSAGSAIAGARVRRTGTRPIVAVLTGLAVLAFLLLLVAAVAVLGGASMGADASSYEAPEDGVAALAEREIPPGYLRLYEQAARSYGLDWAILAGIGKVECDHGRTPAPSCTQEGQVNSAGAGGPMQFLASTWAEYGVDADGDGRADRWDPADAIYTAANYLRASGAPGDYRRAIFAYNHGAGTWPRWRAGPKDMAAWRSLPLLALAPAPRRLQARIRVWTPKSSKAPTCA
jgi:soluble lytic murein transglycosylase-like protein